MARKQSYEVGYGKPPRNGQFPKGTSGNPKGRPKGAVNFRTAIMRAARRPMVVTENGRRRKLSKQEVAAEQLMNKAASGDLRATFGLIMLPGFLDGMAAPAAQVVLSEEDQKVVLAILARIKKAAGGEPGAGGTS